MSDRLEELYVVMQRTQALHDSTLALQQTVQAEASGLKALAVECRAAMKGLPGQVERTWQVSFSKWLNETILEVERFREAVQQPVHDLKNGRLLLKQAHRQVAALWLCVGLAVGLVAGYFVTKPTSAGTRGAAAFENSGSIKLREKHDVPRRSRPKVNDHPKLGGPDDLR